MNLVQLAKTGTCAQVKQAIKAGAEVDSPDGNDFTPLMFAVAGNTEDVVAALLDAGANVNAVNRLNLSVLMVAAWHSKRPEVVRLLVERGANVNYASKASGLTAVMCAAKNTKCDAVVSVLVDAGADLTRIDSNRMTAHDYARTNSALSAQVVESVRVSTPPV